MIGYAGKMVATATAYLMTQGGMGGVPQKPIVPSVVEYEGNIRSVSDNPTKPSEEGAVICLDCILNDEDDVALPKEPSSSFNDDSKYHANNGAITGTRRGYSQMRLQTSRRPTRGENGSKRAWGRRLR
jgi:hypothetical protein